MKRMWMPGAAALAAACIGWGCVGGGGHEPALQRAERQLRDGNTRGAVKTLKRAFASSTNAAERGAASARLLAVLLGTNKVEEAQAWYRRVLDRDARAAAENYGLIEDHLARGRRFADLRQWCRALLKEDVPTNLVRRVCLSEIDACRGEGRDDDAAAALVEGIGRLGDADGCALLADTVAGYRRDGRHEGAEKALAAAEKQFPRRNDLLDAICLQRVEALAARKAFAEALDLLARTGVRLPDAALAAAATRLARAAADGGDASFALRVCDALEGQFAGRPAVQDAALVMRMDPLLAANASDEARRVLLARTKTVSQSALRRQAQRLIRAYERASDTNAVEALAGHLLTGVWGDHAVKDLVFCKWVSAMSGRGRMAEAVARLAQGSALGVSRPGVFVALVDAGYPIMTKGGAEERRALLTLMRGLHADERDAYRQTMLQDMMLDTGFFLEDYDVCLEAIRLPGGEHDAAWRPMIEHKVLAHKALKEGRTDDAVREFRAFMDLIARQPEGQYDPVSGLKIPNAYILGLNARRIGDILKSAGRKDEAAACCREAAGHYGKALEACEKGSALRPQIEQALKDLGN